ncbi:hypothetical protein BOX15_Mlig022870g1 [Macrostomum lignano]|uniref:Uncharacterized protein n=1 Tax=Macrostomum lignano TaxID=282301 RepID=A0A267F3G8_9PLAT|nr:hypothetical protein BOX15_Mlig022870g1 [Macrostomum lignano]
MNTARGVANNEEESDTASLASSGSLTDITGLTNRLLGPSATYPPDAGIYAECHLLAPSVACLATANQKACSDLRNDSNDASNDSEDGSGWLAPPSSDSLLSSSEAVASNSASSSMPPSRLDGKAAREALQRYVADRHGVRGPDCLCGAGRAAAAMELRGLHHGCSVAYRCELLVERRRLQWRCLPYTDEDGSKRQVVLDADGGAARPESPWDIVVPGGELDDERLKHWLEGKATVAVPGTESIRSCGYCRGRGRIQCSDCRSGGKPPQPCPACGSDSKKKPSTDDSAFCSFCGGTTGFLRCSRCSSNGTYVCPLCEGRRRLVWHLELYVVWQRRGETRLAEASIVIDDPQFLGLRLSQFGSEIYRDEARRLAPLTPDRCADDRARRFSRELLPALLQHQSALGRVLAMRHSVSASSVTAVDWELSGRRGRFYVYGTDRRVHFPDYPGRVCQIL